MGKLPSIHVFSKYYKNSLSLEKFGAIPFNPLQATLRNVGGLKARAITELMKLLNVPLAYTVTEVLSFATCK